MKLIVLALVLSCSATIVHPVGQSARQQHDSMVLVQKVCPDGSKGFGTGILVAPDRVLTATHVVKCEIVPGMPLYMDPTNIKVSITKTQTLDAKIEVEVSGFDVSRLKLKDKSFAPYFSEVSVGPKPDIGERVCQVSAVPRSTYRCGEVQFSAVDRILFGHPVESGNSGSGVFDSKGRLVGIVTNLIRCQDGVICSGYGTSLASFEWLVP